MTNSSLAEKYYPTFIDFLLSQKKVVGNVGAKYGLTPMQSLAILMLVEPMPMHKMTESFNCDASNVTGIVDGLQNKDLAGRFENSTDRRVRVVGLMPKGEELREKLINDLLGNVNPIFEKLNQEELNIFFGLINKVISE